MNKPLTPTEEKISIFTDVHANLPTFFVTFDTSHPKLVAPASVKAKPSVVFQYGQVLVTPTNPTLTAEGVLCQLSFGGRNEPTFVPWDAIYCIHFEVEGKPRGKIWQDSIPEAVKQSNAKNQPEAGPKMKPTAEAQRVQQPDGTFSLAAFRENRAARDPKSN